MNTSSTSLIFALLASLASGASGAITGDLSCTEVVDGVLKYTAAAVACENQVSDEACEFLYPEGETDAKWPTAGGVEQRSPSCYTTRKDSPAVVDVNMKTISVAHCAKTCGYCCQRDAFATVFGGNCTGIKPTPTLPTETTKKQFTCADVDLNLCNNMNPEFKRNLDRLCPNACRHLGCFDMGPCNYRTWICLDKQLAFRKCRRSCGLCVKNSVFGLTGDLA